MTPLRTEKLIAYLALFSGLLISGVAEFYSIVGLTAIFPTAFIPIVIMGVALGVGKLVATVWLKQNWNIAPFTIKIYLLVAIFTLMFITSMGIFGFLSKAHSDQGMVSGDVQAKIAVYDEKIKIAKENIDANRRALKQLDEAVDQVMGRSQDEKGADKAVAIRRGQAKERTRLLQEITAEQKTIAQLNEERAPIAAEVRKVEAEVGPIKYIAKLVYSDNPDANILEKAVSWVIVLIVIVFDPMAVILLLSSQISFQRIREQENPIDWQARTEELLDIFDQETPDHHVADSEEKPGAEEVDDDLFPTYEEITPKDDPAPHHPDTHPYLRAGFGKGFENLKPMVYKPEPKVPEEPKEYVVDATLIDALEGTVNRLQEENEQLKKKLTEKLSQKEKEEIQSVYIENERLKQELADLRNNSYVQNEEQLESGLWNKIQAGKKVSEAEYLEQSRKKHDNPDNAS